jgi:glycosyltransferase involved in cell wall biosynthesis
MKLLSIIVPIYNVEPYVERCLLSLETQDISANDYEIICINDGSPDNSREVVLRLQKKFSNIILVDQVNQGVSHARNNGIKRADAKYLLFIDPDDFIQINSLGVILKLAESNHAQIVIPGYTFIDLDDNLLGITNYDNHDEKNVTGIDAFILTHNKEQVGADLAVGIIFEAEFLNNNDLNFLPNVPYLEDGEFLARSHCLASRSFLTKFILYTHVLARQGSATNSDLFISERARNGFVIAANNLKYFRTSRQLDTRQKLFLNGSIVQFVLLAVYSAIKTRSLKSLNSTIKDLKDYGLGTLNLEGCRGWYRVCGKPYNFSPYFGALVLAFYLKLNNLNYHWFKKRSRKQ